MKKKFAPRIEKKLFISKFGKEFNTQKQVQRAWSNIPNKKFHLETGQQILENFTPETRQKILHYNLTINCILKKFTPKFRQRILQKKSLLNFYT